MNFSPGSDITCLFRNKRIKITQDLIRSILHLEDGGIRLYTTKTILHTDEYNPVEACCHVTGKHFKAAHMSCVLSGTRPKALSYGMILTKKFQHFEISFHDSVAILPKATDTINILTLKRMKIFKENGQCVAKSKWFDDESGPSTLPFEGEDIHNDEDVPPPSPPRPRSHRPSSSTSSFTFTEDHYNLLNGRIDSLASTVDGLQHVVSDLQNTAVTIQTRVGGLQTSVDGITSMFHALHSYLGTGFPPPPPPEM
ncbi:Uncharacterized protein Adt_11815 [Abeliophyllum distichum]|uniref:GRAM domain-containing protein n=1 Tax=Abeliophyllum distichum TaxID=126358 RepID=A0ABD1UP75_9LAMI